MTANSDLTGRTALVTGGGVGIGAAVARRLAAAGVRVAVTYRTHPPTPEFTGIAVDACDDTQVRNAVEKTLETLGSLDILVNNVGSLLTRATLDTLDLTTWRSVLSVNLDSMFLFSHHAVGHLSRTGAGRVINVGSLAGHTGGHPGALAYATAKAGVFGFTRALATELGPQRITVNALAPGFIEATPFHDTFTTAESKQRTISIIPAGRAGLPDDVAGAVAWLACDDAAFVNGAVIDVNGGQYFH